MDWFTSRDAVSVLLGPSPSAILIAIMAVLLIPLFLHFIIYQSASSTTLPTFLLVGPSGSGKTSLLTLFERGQLAETRTSQTPLTVEVSLPITTQTTSSKYRSSHDPSLQIHKRFLLADTPGHGKLRHYAFSSIAESQNLRGIIFVVDAADLASGSEALHQAAEYLHDVLLLLQRRSAASSKRTKPIPVLIAANKLDLFTALPAAMVKSVLEAEITNVRLLKSKGLLDSGIGASEDGGEEKGWLGEMGEGGFKFEQMEDEAVEVVTVGGSVTGEHGEDVQKWWDWVGMQL